MSSVSDKLQNIHSQSNRLSVLQVPVVQQTNQGAVSRVPVVRLRPETKRHSSDKDLPVGQKLCRSAAQWRALISTTIFRILNLGGFKVDFSLGPCRCIFSQHINQEQRLKLKTIYCTVSIYTGIKAQQSLLRMSPSPPAALPAYKYGYRYHFMLTLWIKQILLNLPSFQR